MKRQRKRMPRLSPDGSKVAYFSDGFPGWKAAGGAVNTGEKP